MRAMQLAAPGKPLRFIQSRLPRPGPGELLIAVCACGVCRTDLHVADGDIVGKLPVTPGHEIVGRVAAVGPGAA
ncbi:MAG: alcohol dehydrogenase catalytic domain-containing protein, partial [Pseudomonadota bacterium]|nr:alcohol dehydrogenase catalytic domain-containing protein [Pseudomonadota bacterium]